MTNDFFLLFDYSPQVGEKLGKPWSVVEKGKCYEIDSKGGFLYRIKIINGNERQEYSDYKKYKPTDDIILNENNNENIERLWPYKPSGLGISLADEIYFTGIEAGDLFPTKYEFGQLVTYTTVITDPSDLKIANNILKDENFLKIKTLYSDLAKQLENTIRLCDNRIRVEYQLTIRNDNIDKSQIFWKLSNGDNFSLEKWPDYDNSNPLKSRQPNYSTIFKKIELMGCKNSFGEYIKSHKGDFENIDQLSQELINKYPDIVKEPCVIAPPNYVKCPIWKGYQIMEKRDENVIQKILAFANVSEFSENVSDSTEKETLENDSLKNLENTTSTTQNEFKPTPLDQPTSQKKISILFNSKNPLIRIYILLPIIALVGIIIFLLLKKYRKQK